MIITYTRPDGGLSIVVAAPKNRLERVMGSLTDEQYRAHVLERSIPADAINPQVMPEDWTPPADRTFRDAWRLNGTGVAVDMPRAREIQRGRLRNERAPRLAALDVEAIRAVERGDAAAVAAVGQRKQALRDAPAHPAIEAAATPEELKAITLDALL